MQKRPFKLKRAVIKEELIAITGNFIEAVILNQMIYWSERINDFDNFIREKRKEWDLYKVHVTSWEVERYIRRL